MADVSTETLHQAALQSTATHRELETALVLARRDRVSLPLNDSSARQRADEACISAERDRDAAGVARDAAHTAYGRSLVSSPHV